MEYIKQFIDIFLHLDAHLNTIIETYGTLTYLILFLIIFCETGLVVLPILPGDSLLFAAGALAASKGSPLNAPALFFLLGVAAILGDSVNYGIGKFVGPKVFSDKPSRFFNREYLDRTHAFYERYGGKTIIFARFIPIIRTFAPFVGGVGAMTYGKFIVFNIVGGLAWIALFIFGGYFFGTLPVVRQNFTLVIIAIILLSVMPAVIEYLRNRFKKKV